jgi:dipeptidyl-peptidase-4
MAKRLLTLEDIVDLPGPARGMLVQPRFSPDNRQLWYLHPEGDGERLALYVLSVQDGRREVVLTASGEDVYTQAELLRRERQRLRWGGISSYQVVWRDGEPVVLAPIGGRLLLREGKAAPHWVDGVGPVEDPQLLADGRRIVYVQDGDLAVWDGATGNVLPLTTGAEPGLTHGVAEYVAQEELGRMAGYWVSPTLTWIAFQETDVRHIPEYPIVHWEDARPWVETPRYPFAGEANARVRLAVMPLGGGEARWICEVGDDAYLARVVWTPDDKLAYALLSRDHRRLSWRVWDPASGESRPLAEETAPHWVNVASIHRFLPDGRFLTSTEESGYRHLVLIGPDQDRHFLTGGPWVVTDVVGLDAVGGWVYFIGTKDSPLERHLYRVALDGGDVERLSQEEGFHNVTLSDDGMWLLDQHQSRQHAVRAEIGRTDGTARRVVAVEEAATAESLGLEPPELVTLAAADGTPLYGALYRPKTGAPPWPAVVSVYGGPHAQTVAESWALTVDYEAQYLAQQGFLVFKLDNRGMANRGVAFERPIHRRFGTVEVEDQVAGVKWLVAEQQVDPKRVGVTGWSYGGYMTLMCLEKAPDVFRAGVAGAPVTDYRFYDTAYTERYMGTPADNAAGYDDGSALTFVDRLDGDLLVIHGLLDENVHFRNTVRLLMALAEAGKSCELMLLPTSRHGPRGRATRLAIVRRRTAFLMEHLSGKAR